MDLEMEDDQRRRDVRVVAHREVDVRYIDRTSGVPDGDSFAAEVRNISVGGALMVLDEPLWRGTLVEIRVAWAEPRLVTKLRAHVVRVAPCHGGIAVSVEFHHSGRSSRLDILRWVLQEARRTEQLARPARAQTGSTEPAPRGHPGP